MPETRSCAMGSGPDRSAENRRIRCWQLAQGHQTVRLLYMSSQYLFSSSFLLLSIASLVTVYTLQEERTEKLDQSSITSVFVDDLDAKAKMGEKARADVRDWAF